MLKWIHDTSVMVFSFKILAIHCKNIQFCRQYSSQLQKKLRETYCLDKKQFFGSHPLNLYFGDDSMNRQLAKKAWGTTLQP